MQEIEGRVLRPRKGAPEPAVKVVKRKIKDPEPGSSAKPAKQPRKGKKLEPKPKQAPKKLPEKVLQTSDEPKQSKLEPKSKQAPKKQPEEVLQTSDEPKQTSIHDFEVTTIDGQQKPLKDYKNHVCIIVNVASRCGHTGPNYKRLVELYEKYNAKGLRILAFPCNQFSKQEPGDNPKIKEFAKKKGVEFDMFAKIDVKGANAEPLWEYLNRVCPGPKPDIEWNFVKFLVEKDGQVVKRYKPSVKSLVDLEEDLNNVCQIV